VAWILAIFGATLAAYLPSIHGGVLWDDAAHITARPLQSWGGLWRIWFRLGTTQQYYPMLHSAFWVEHRLWGDSVLGYHLANIGLHATAACLFAAVLARIQPHWDGRAPGAVEWLAAAVFALHPVCVESVAWISEQKNTLSLVFYLLSAVAYLRFDRGRRWAWYALALLLFAFALLSKSVTASLPGALLLALCWRRGRLAWLRDVVPLIPWFVIGACSGLFTAWVERNFIGARGEAFDLSLLERCLLAGRIVWFYLGKLVWPADLMFIYPHWRVVADWSWGWGCLALLALLAILWGIRRWNMAPLLALLFFVGSLFPALGFVNVYPFIFSYVADHWQYAASLGIVALGAEGAAAAARAAAGRLDPSARSAARGMFAGAAAAVIAALFILTWRQSGHYRDAGVLYADTLARNPQCWMADNNLGVYLMDRGSLDGAVSHLEEAVRLKPDYSDAHNNLGNALSKIPGRSAEAISEFEAALRLEPGMAQAHANLGSVLARAPGRQAEAVDQLRAALRGNEDNPDYAIVHANLAALLAKFQGHLPDAIAEYEAALRLTPDAAEVRDNLGVSLARSGRAEEAVAQFDRALRLEPGNPAFHDNRGGALSQVGRPQEAIAEYRAALRLDPGLVQAHFNLARALRTVGDGAGAIAEYREALRLAPDSPEIRNSLGSFLLQQGRASDAVGEYEEAVRLQPGSPALLNNLGIALTRAGRLDEAMDRLRSALQLAPGYAEAHYNLGLALHRAGREDEAHAQFVASGRSP
jgi:tetratricopeptide (TPR) repeat protein